MHGKTVEPLDLCVSFVTEAPQHKAHTALGQVARFGSLLFKNINIGRT
jgi:hypothetical protein